MMHHGGIVIAAASILVTSCVLVYAARAADPVGDVPPSDHSRLALQSLLNGKVVERQKLMADLIQKLEHPSSNGDTLSSVYLLGVFRMEQAPSHLIKFISFRDDEWTGDALPLWGSYPVVEALVKIGTPSIPTVTDLIERSDVELERRLATQVMRGVLGSELAKVKLERAAGGCERSGDPRAATRLRAAIDLIEPDSASSPKS